jgi:hypothetical protein
VVTVYYEEQKNSRPAKASEGKAGHPSFELFQNAALSS